jgi:hypothetical protein
VYIDTYTYKNIYIGTTKVSKKAIKKGKNPKGGGKIDIDNYNSDENEDFDTNNNDNISDYDDNIDHTGNNKDHTHQNDDDDGDNYSGNKKNSGTIHIYVHTCV